MSVKMWSVLCAGAVVAALPKAASAQPLIILPDQRTLSASVGVSANGDAYSGDHAPDLSLAVELPLAQPYRLRLSAGRVAWQFGKDEAPPAARLHDVVTLGRGTVSLVKMVVPQMVGNPFGLYVGAGAGVYHYGFRRGSGAVPTRWGLHLLAGVDYQLPHSRLVVGWEAQLHAVRGPSSGQVNSYDLTLGQAMVVLKYRF